MKSILRGLPAFLIAVSLLSVLLFSCKGKTDSDITTAFETQKKENQAMAGVIASVKDGVVTLTGECKDEACKASCETFVKGLPGVKQVINNCSVAASAIGQPSASIAVDELLKKGVIDATKDFPDVIATVKEGVVTLKGAIKRTDLKKLLMSLQTLQPKKINNQLTIN